MEKISLKISFRVIFHEKYFQKIHRETFLLTIYLQNVFFGASFGKYIYKNIFCKYISRKIMSKILFCKYIVKKGVLESVL